MRQTAFVSMLTLALVATFGCSESTTIEPDGGISFDAAPPPDGSTMDAAPDDADVPPEGDIGQPCSSAADCEFECFPAPDLPGGYCTNACGSDADCPGEASCIPVGRGQQFCFANCDPAATERECRAGYGCSESFMFPGNVCFPGCTDDTDCSGGAECDPGGGSGAGACFDPGSSTGDACVEDDMCPADSFCLAEDFTGWPGGACIGFGCDASTNTGCEGDDVCIPTGMGGGACVAACTDDSGCRDAYRCEPHEDFADRLFCNPGCAADSDCASGNVCNPVLGTCDVPLDESELGTPCSTRRGACAGGSCFTEFETGFPGSYCAFLGCDATADDADDGCPGDGVCLAGDDSNVCLDGCTDDRDCRAPDYECRPVDAERPAAGNGCFPSCTNDDACANDGSDGAPDFSCNPGTGLCTDPFVAANLGEPCESGDDCPGGACVSEAAEGWPAGACLAVGCRLSGDGPEAPCPTGGVCVDDDTGDPTLGACVVACTTDTSGCRPGYACVALDAGTDGSCLPACADDGDCGASRTCNTTTGICE